MDEDSDKAFNGGRQATIRVQDVKKIYRMDGVEVAALKGVSLDIELGEFVAIMGTSGSGKSTLMHITGCLDRPTEGAIYLDGIDISELNDNSLADIRNKKIGFIFQSFNLLARTAAITNVELPLLYAGVPRGERRRRAKEALERVGLGQRLGHFPSQLSGGEQQRVAIARALINNPSLVLADEPTGNLDSRSGAEVMRILGELHERGITLIMVTHDRTTAEHADRIIHIKDGLIVGDEKVDRIHVELTPEAEEASALLEEGPVPGEAGAAPAEPLSALTLEPAPAEPAEPVPVEAKAASEDEAVAPAEKMPGAPVPDAVPAEAPLATGEVAGAAAAGAERDAGDPGEPCSPWIDSIKGEEPVRAEPAEVTAPVAEEPAPAEEPALALAEEPAPAVKPSTAKKPAAAKKPSTAKKPAAAKKPSPAKKPAAAKKPSPAKKPAAAKKASTVDKKADGSGMDSTRGGSKGA